MVSVVRSGLCLALFESRRKSGRKFGGSNKNSIVPMIGILTCSLTHWTPARLVPYLIATCCSFHPSILLLSTSNHIISPSSLQTPQSFAVPLSFVTILLAATTDRLGVWSAVTAVRTLLRPQVDVPLLCHRALVFRCNSRKH